MSKIEDGASCEILVRKGRKFTCMMHGTSFAVWWMETLHLGFTRNSLAFCSCVQAHCYLACALACFLLTSPDTIILTKADALWSTDMAKPSNEFVLLLLLLVRAVSVIECRSEYKCHGSPEAIAALQSDGNVTINRIPGIGYGFLGPTGVAPPFVGGPNVTRGLVLMPEDGVAPEAYAPLARGNDFFTYRISV